MIQRKIIRIKPVTHGVPQGSILGPLLFILHMNDLPLHVQGNLDLYADDSTLNAHGKTIHEIEMSLNADLQCIHEWCSRNKMVLNTTKTKVMLVTTHQKCRHLVNKELCVTYDSEKLVNVESENLLGVIIDNHLTWQEHVAKVAKTVNKNIALLRRIRKYLPHSTRLTYYKSFIQPHLDYCNTIWGQSTYISRLHVAQKMALRLINDAPKLTHSAPLFQQCKIMTIQKRVQYRTSILVYKTLNGAMPSYMDGMFKKVSEVSTRITRSTTDDKLYVPRCSLCVGRRSTRYNGPIVFNSLPENIRMCNTLSSFKSNVYKHIM